MGGLAAGIASKSSLVALLVIGSICFGFAAISKIVADKK